MISQSVSCHFKVIATNTVTLQIDATRIWKWCNQNLMTLNISKCKTLNFKGNGRISMNGKTLEQTQKEKDLGINVSNDLTWTANTERRCEKAIKVFLPIKRNIANGTSWIGKRIFTGATLSQSFHTVQFFGNQINQN